MPGKGKQYAPEFKEQAARKVVDNSLPIAQVAREIGVNDTTLGFWVKDYRKKMAGQPLPPDMPDQERIRELVPLGTSKHRVLDWVLRPGAKISFQFGSGVTSARAAPVKTMPRIVVSVPAKSTVASLRLRTALLPPPNPPAERRIREMEPGRGGRHCLGTRDPI